MILKTKSLYVSVIAAASILANTSLLAGDVYQYTDNQGLTHYSSTFPTGQSNIRKISGASLEKKPVSGKDLEARLLAGEDIDPSEVNYNEQSRIKSIGTSSITNQNTPQRNNSSSQLQDLEVEKARLNEQLRAVEQEKEILATQNYLNAQKKAIEKERTELSLATQERNAKIDSLSKKEIEVNKKMQELQKDAQTLTVLTNENIKLKKVNENAQKELATKIAQQNSMLEVVESKKATLDFQKKQYDAKELAYKTDLANLRKEQATLASEKSAIAKLKSEIELVKKEQAAAKISLDNREKALQNSSGKSSQLQNELNSKMAATEKALRDAEAKLRFANEQAAQVNSEDVDFQRRKASLEQYYQDKNRIVEAEAAKNATQKARLEQIEISLKDRISKLSVYEDNLMAMGKELQAKEMKLNQFAKDIDYNSAAIKGKKVELFTKDKDY